ncbi:siphovirus ReqiPepy6 Gp37-like family protein [Virgibacillus sp. M23]|uniref:siphovirus ReqiPepy6 Gp37-like family protein n=1 Tax=Virgibacillus sp. M23 TaxID=3079030 RepID=UPI002A90FCB3|nr:siphovirus ReqiPepy6 Gp37-like family protein [Virgibacillus sp. M23]MDY7044436.1 siphovirus ReqiPepy6 Gp37-like family protein [Virgibacillus sp. M23]
MAQNKLMPIRILSQDLNLLGEIDNYESLQYPRSLHSIGNFDLRINRYKQHTEKLVKNALIMLGSQLNKVGIIKHREIKLDENGKGSEQWTIKGYQLKGIVGQRLSIPPAHTDYDRKSGPAETVMKHYISQHLVNPDDPNRKIPHLVIAEDKGRGQHVTWQSRFKNIAEELQDISLATELGWDITLDLENKQFIFDVVEGINKTTDQSDVPPILFSPEFETVKSQSFSDSDLNMKNYGYVAGQGEGVEREVIEIGESTGLERVETFIDARDIENSSELAARGQQKMKELQNEFYLEAEILSSSPFQYGRDYDLGDITTLQNRSWGLTRNARITEISEVYEPGAYQIEATFGQSRPTLTKKIKEQFSEYERLLKM